MTNSPETNQTAINATTELPDTFPLQWEQTDFDDNDNPIWSASSFWAEDGAQFEYTIAPVLEAGVIKYRITGDLDVTDQSERDERFDTLEAAQAYLQIQENEAWRGAVKDGLITRNDE